MYVCKGLETKNKEWWIIVTCVLQILKADFHSYVCAYVKIKKFTKIE